MFSPTFASGKSQKKITYDKRQTQIMSQVGGLLWGAGQRSSSGRGLHDNILKVWIIWTEELFHCEGREPQIFVTIQVTNHIYTETSLVLVKNTPGGVISLSLLTGFPYFISFKSEYCWQMLKVAIISNRIISHERYI